jgi:hypothetical protein
MESEATVSPILALSALGIVFVSLLAFTIAELPFASPLRALVFDHTQKLILVVAGAAMLASLYYSQIVGFIPCEFCWYQRIAMYPITVLLLVAIVTRSRISPRYIVTMAAIGLALSVYHYQMQLFPEGGGACTGPIPCTAKYVDEFGFVTIPFMAGCSFLTILVLQFNEWRVERLFKRWDESATA